MGVICPWPCLPQSGNNAAVDAKRKELEAKRAAQASRGEKTFYKVTVRVSAWKGGGLGVVHVLACMHGCGHVVATARPHAAPPPHTCRRTTAWAWLTRTSPTCWAVC